MAFCLKSKSRDAIIEQVNIEESRIVVGGWVFLHFVFVFGYAMQTLLDIWDHVKQTNQTTHLLVYLARGAIVSENEKTSLPKEIRREGSKKSNLKKEKYFMPDDSKHDAHGKIQLFCRWA